MPIARTLQEEWDYTLESEREDDGATVFHLGSLTREEEARASDRLSRAGAAGMLEECDRICVLGIRGWSNFLDAKGSEVKCRIRKGKCHPDNLIRLEPKHRIELGLTILDRNQLDEADQD